MYVAANSPRKLGFRPKSPVHAPNPTCVNEMCHSRLCETEPLSNGAVNCQCSDAVAKPRHSMRAACMVREMYHDGESGCWSRTTNLRDIHTFSYLNVTGSWLSDRSATSLLESPHVFTLKTRGSLHGIVFPFFNYFIWRSNFSVSSPSILILRRRCRTAVLSNGNRTNLTPFVKKPGPHTLRESTFV